MELLKSIFTSPEFIYIYIIIVLIIVGIIFLKYEGIKKFITNSAFKTVAAVTFFAVIFIFITFNWLIELSSFAVGMANGALGLLLVWVFDKYAMKEIDTVEELKKGNQAYATFFLGICIIVAAAIINS